MSRRTTALAAALSLLPLGQPLLLGSTTALATAAVVLSTQAAHAQSADDYVNAGVEKGKRGDFKGAIADFTRAIDIDPQYAYAYFNRGTAKRKSGDSQGAIADFNKAIEINPQHALAFANRGDSKKRLGNEKDACTDYKKSASLGYQGAAQWLNSAGGAWCRNMR